MAVFRIFFTIQVAVESQPHWPATSKDTPRAAGRWACTLLSHSSVGWWKLRPGHVGQGNTSTNHPIFLGAFSSIHISFSGVWGKKNCMIMYVWCVCVLVKDSLCETCLIFCPTTWIKSYGPVLPSAFTPDHCQTALKTYQKTKRDQLYTSCSCPSLFKTHAIQTWCQSEAPI